MLDLVPGLCVLSLVLRKSDRVMVVDGFSALDVAFGLAADLLPQINTGKNIN